MLKNRLSLLLAIAILLTCFTVPTVFAATAGSHYTLGGEGVMAATGPPPGFHYRMYNLVYSADDYVNDDGDKSDFDIDVFAQVHRFVHTTDIQLLGGQFAYNVIIPVLHKEISPAPEFMPDLEFDNDFEVGDIVLEPFALFWWRERFDAALGLAAILPTGDYDSDDAASPGLGYWSGMLTLGGTYYFDQAKTWTASVLTRTLYNFEQDETDITPGMEFAFEGGIGKQLKLNDKWMMRPGLTLNGSTQISDDDGGASNDDRKRVYGAGAEVHFMYLPWALQAELRYTEEFAAKNTTEGSTLAFTITKSFF